MCQCEGVGWEGVGVRRDEEGSWCASVKVWRERERGRRDEEGSWCASVKVWRERERG